MVADFLERLSPNIVIQRLFAAAPDDILIAPVWNKTRSEFLRDLDDALERLPATDRDATWTCASRTGTHAFGFG